MSTVGPERTAPLDAVARRTLASLVELPGVHRAGLALTEGGGRRLRFTSSDRQGVDVEWCHIDAFDDVPLTAVLRSGRRISGTLRALADRFPDFARKQCGTSTVALVSEPLVADGAVVGGLVVYLEEATALGPHTVAAIADLARAAADDVQRTRQRPATLLLVSPDEAGVVAHLRVDGADGVAPARRHLRDALRQVGVGDQVIDDAVLCLSEIVTNAVMHTEAPSDVRVAIDQDLLRIDVRDLGSRLGHRPAPVDLGDVLRVHGRGLQILDALATSWGSDPDPTGTTVWFVLELAGTH